MKYLIVIDMQNDFIDGSLGSEDAKAIVDTVAGKVKSFEGTVLYTMDTHSENYMETQEGQKLPVKHCIKGTKGWDLNPKIRKVIESKGGTKFEKGSFGSPDLAAYLMKANEQEKIDEIELCGLCTDICVISNAMMLKSCLPETEIVVDSNGCRGVSHESHKTALEAMKTCQITIK